MAALRIATSHFRAALRMSFVLLVASAASPKLPTDVDIGNCPDIATEIANNPDWASGTDVVFLQRSARIYADPSLFNDTAGAFIFYWRK